MDDRRTTPRSRETAAETTDELDGPHPASAGALTRGDALGRYTVLEPLGSGAMGLVYAAYDSTLDRRVAIKLLHARPGHEEGGRRAQRLLREAQAMAQLTHPNVVTVHEAGTASGRVYLAMEYVQGTTLTRWLEHPRAWREVVEVFVAAGQGLAAAHAKGLVHRDFKPDNVMIGDDGRVRVMDFGLARAGDDQISEGSEELGVATQLTLTGAVLGTPAYMAPEQHMGRAIDARSDQFSYCVALHEALYGVRPFAGESLAALGMAVTMGLVIDPPPGRVVPKWLRRVVLRGLSPAPGDRFADMAELLRVLQHDPRGRPGTAVLVSVGAIALAAAAWIGRPRDEPTSAPCRDAARHLEGLWDQARAARVAEAMRATGSPMAADTVARVHERLDRYVGGWVAMRTSSCEATRVRGEQSEALLDLRNACLDERLRRVDDLVAVLERADAAVVERAVAAVAELPSIEPCADAAALRSRLPPPRDPAEATAVEQLRATIGRAHALVLAGRYDPARLLARESTEQADALGYLPVVAEAHALDGEVSLEAGQPALAQQALGRAYFSALQVHHDELAARVAANLTYVVGYQLARHDEGARWGEHALALGLRVGEGGLAEADACHALGVLANAVNDVEAASRHHERAFALRSALLPPDHPDLGRSLSALGSVLLERALALYERGFGPDHPVVADALVGLGAARLGRGRAEDARAVLERAVELLAQQGSATDEAAEAATLLERARAAGP